MNELLLRLNSEAQTSKFVLQMTSMDYTHITVYLEVSMIHSNLFFLLLTFIVNTSLPAGISLAMLELVIIS